jgi:hypothetical protein
VTETHGVIVILSEQRIQQQEENFTSLLQRHVEISRARFCIDCRLPVQWHLVSEAMKQVMQRGLFESTCILDCSGHGFQILNVHSRGTCVGPKSTGERVRNPSHQHANGRMADCDRVLVGMSLPTELWKFLLFDDNTGRFHSWHSISRSQCRSMRDITAL